MLCQVALPVELDLLGQASMTQLEPPDAATNPLSILVLSSHQLFTYTLLKFCHSL